MAQFLSERKKKRSENGCLIEQIFDVFERFDIRRSALFQPDNESREHPVMKGGEHTGSDFCPIGQRFGHGVKKSPIQRKRKDDFCIKFHFLSRKAITFCMSSQTILRMILLPSFLTK